MATKKQVKQEPEADIKIREFVYVGIDDETWKKAIEKAQKKGTTMAFVLRTFIGEYSEAES